MQANIGGNLSQQVILFSLQTRTESAQNLWLIEMRWAFDKSRN